VKWQLLRHTSRCLLVKPRVAPEIASSATYRLHWNSRTATKATRLFWTGLISDLSIALELQNCKQSNKTLLDWPQDVLVLPVRKLGPNAIFKSACKSASERKESAVHVKRKQTTSLISDLSIALELQNCKQQQDSFGLASRRSRPSGAKAEAKRYLQVGVQICQRKERKGCACGAKPND